MEAAPGPAVEAVEMAAEGAEEVDEGTQKIVEEDLCGLAAVVMMPLDRLLALLTGVLYVCLICSRLFLKFC